ncbi:MAG: hypothetical protein M3T96_01085, partial [Acidobacteriota bacterium]|nr:hypothetical protein [Acidobacteriota bacterium]
MQKIKLSFFLLICCTVSITAQKITADDVLAKHLNSIGTAEARAAAKTAIAVGNAEVRSVTKITTPVVGRIVIASAGIKSFWGLSLNSTDYPSEKFSYDGKNAKVALVKLGVRSTLGNFVQSNNLMLEQGLFGGTLSTAWALLDAPTRKAKLSMEGSKKIDGKDAYVLGYSPKGGGDIDVKLYFDKETFRHVRTEYKRISSAGIGSRPEDSSKFSENRIALTEDFSDFKPEGNLTLPHHYHISYTTTGNSNGSTNI